LKRETNRLTALTVKAHINNGRQGRFPDGGNLFLKIDNTGTPSWIMRFVSPVHKRTRDFGLGRPSEVSLAEARAQRDDARRLIDGGIDPIDHRQAIRAVAIAEGQKTMSFGECAAAWCEAVDLELKRKKTRQERRRSIAQHLAALWKVPASAVTPVMVTNTLKSLVLSGKVSTAHKLRAYVRAILDYADKLGTPTNSAKFTGTYFRGLLPNKEKVQPTAHCRALPIDDVPAFITQLKQQPGSAPKALLFAVLCALRSNEAINLKWSWIDISNKVVTFPAEAMKTGKEFRCALSSQAMGLITSMPRLKDCEFVFPGRWGGKLSDRMLFSVISRMPGYDGITVHGFRSCFRDYIGERTDFDTIAAEHALAHQVGSAVTRAYARLNGVQSYWNAGGEWKARSRPMRDCRQRSTLNDCRCAVGRSNALPDALISPSR
jgi:integrase